MWPEHYKDDALDYKTYKWIPLDPEIKLYALKFREKYPEGYVSPNIFLWIHDAIHGWLNLGVTDEDEVFVYHCEEIFKIFTFKDFVELIELFKPEEVISHIKIHVLKILS